MKASSMTGTRACYAVAVFSVALGTQNLAVGQSSIGADQTPNPDSRATWKVRQEDAAIATALSFLSNARKTDLVTEARVVKLTQNRIPYLGHKYVGRQVWRVTIENWKIVYPSFPEVKDRVARTLDVYVEPTEGKLLEIQTRWPRDEPVIVPLPSAASWTEELRRGGNEVYHGFPDQPPKVAFFSVFDAMGRCGADATQAKQLIAHYVVWSRIGKWKEPRAVWAIVLRGTPPPLPSSVAPQTDGPIFNSTTIVDAVTGECIGISNTPKPSESVTDDD